MGCFNASCNISGLPIKYGDKCYLILLKENNLSYSNSLCYAHDLFRPMALPVLGEYDDYGFISNIQDSVTNRLLKHYLKSECKPPSPTGLMRGFMKNPYNKEPSPINPDEDWCSNQSPYTDKMDKDNLKHWLRLIFYTSKSPTKDRARVVYTLVKKDIYDALPTKIDMTGYKKMLRKDAQAFMKVICELAPYIKNEQAKINRMRNEKKRSGAHLKMWGARRPLDDWASSASYSEDLPDCVSPVKTSEKGHNLFSSAMQGRENHEEYSYKQMYLEPLVLSAGEGNITPQSKKWKDMREELIHFYLVGSIMCYRIHKTWIPERTTGQELGLDDMQAFQDLVQSSLTKMSKKYKREMCE